MPNLRQIELVDENRKAIVLLPEFIRCNDNPALYRECQYNGEPAIYSKLTFDFIAQRIGSNTIILNEINGNDNSIYDLPNNIFIKNSDEQYTSCSSVLNHMSRNEVEYMQHILSSSFQNFDYSENNVAFNNELLQSYFKHFKIRSIDIGNLEIFISVSKKSNILKLFQYCIGTKKSVQVCFHPILQCYGYWIHKNKNSNIYQYFGDKQDS